MKNIIKVIYNDPYYILIKTNVSKDYLKKIEKKAKNSSDPTNVFLNTLKEYDENSEMLYDSYADINIYEI
jgi:hypothetical protein